MLLLIASVMALFVGPLLLRLLGARATVLAAIDGFVVVGLGGVLVMHLLPESLAVAGAAAVVAAAIGVAIPPLLERQFAKRSATVSAAVVTLAMIGLAIHAMLDGAALALELEHGERSAHDLAHAASHGGGMLAVAVLLHRVPIGLTIWWLVGRGQHARRGIATLALITVATVAGFAGAQPLLDALPARGLAILQALVAGLLFHAVFAHRPNLAGATGPQARRWSVLGGLLAAAPLALVTATHTAQHSQHGELQSWSTFITLALESAPALLLAFIGAGVMLGLLSPGSTRWLGGGGPLAQSARGMLFGLPMPVCSCGVVPVYRSLIKAGVPASAAMAFLIATPEIGLDAVLISFPLLGANLAITRLVCAAIIALLVGVLLGRVVPPAHEQHAEQAAGTPRLPLTERLRRGLAFGLGELFDHVGPWIIAGLFLAAMVEPLVDGAWLSRLPPAAQVPLMALLGLPMYVCASGATPLVAVLMHKGLSGGAAIAFLLTGPATNLVTFGVLSALHGRRVALAFGALVSCIAIALGFAVNAWLPTADLQLHQLASSKPSWLNIASLLILAALVVMSIARQGPRGFIEQLFSVEGGHDHHDHAHDHAHGEGHHDHSDDHAHPAPAHGDGHHNLVDSHAHHAGGHVKRSQRRRQPRTQRSDDHADDAHPAG